MTCPLCLANSPRMKANLRCCTVRFLSKLPKHVRQQYYEKIQREQGEDAVRALITEVKQAHERRRLQALQAAGLRKLETGEVA